MPARITEAEARRLRLPDAPAEEAKPGGANLARPAGRRCDGTQVGDWTDGLELQLMAGGWRSCFRADQWVCAWRDDGERTAYYRTMRELIAVLGL